MNTPTEVIQSAREHGARLIDLKADRHLRYLATLQPRPRIERRNLRGWAAVDSVVDLRPRDAHRTGTAAPLIGQPVQRIRCVDLDIDDQKIKPLDILHKSVNTCAKQKSGGTIRRIVNHTFI